MPQFVFCCSQRAAVQYEKQRPASIFHTLHCIAGKIMMDRSIDILIELCLPAAHLTHKLSKTSSTRRLPDDDFWVFFLSFRAADSRRL